MSTSNPIRITEKGGDDRALALKMAFDIEVRRAFRRRTLLWNAVNGEAGMRDNPESAPPSLVASRVVESGKSYQFIEYADGPAPEHVLPGNELLGQQAEFDEGTITIDDLLVSHRGIPFDGIQLAHYDALVPAARDIGERIAEDFDKKGIIMAILAARTAAKTKNGLTVHNGGNVVQRTAASVAAAYPVDATGAANFRANCTSLARLMDEDGVPENNRFMMITPYIREVLQYGTDIFNRDYGRTNNDLNKRIIGEIAGFQILPPTTHIPNTNITTYLGNQAKYNGDFSFSGNAEPQAVVMVGESAGRAAIGYVAGVGRVGPIYTHMMIDERRNEVFMKGQLMAGWGVLSPYCAGLIEVNSS